MDSNFESHSPDNADREPSFRKPSNEKANRKYRRHSSASGSASSSSDESPKHGRNRSPTFSREDPTRISDVHLRKKNGGRELDMESGRNRFDKGGDSHRQSDRRSYRSSHDYHRHGDYNKHHKRADEGERSYHRSSGSGRESRSGTRSDHDRTGGYRQNVDKYALEKSDGEEHRGKDKDREERNKHWDKDSTMERATSGRRHINSYADDSKSGKRDRHNKDGGVRDDMKYYSKSLGDYKNDNTSSAEEGIGHGRHSSAGKESGGSRLKETQKSNIKDLGRKKGDTMEKRKHDDRESDRHKERFFRETDGRDYSLSSKKSYGRDEQYQDNPTRINEDNESSPKKFKLFNADKEKNKGKDGQILSKSTVAADERSPSRSKLPKETIHKVIPELVQPSNEAEASHDFNAAKVAAMKAAELVNRNLTGGGFMSTDQKKKLLWGSKKNTVAEEPVHRWDAQLFPDRERQEKFNKLMSLRLPWCLWPIVGGERRFEITRAQTGEQGQQWPSPGREAGATPVGFREAVHCWTTKKRWSYCRTWSVTSSASNCALMWKDHAYVISFGFQIFGKRCFPPKLLNSYKVYAVFKASVAIWIHDFATFENPRVLGLNSNCSKMLTLRPCCAPIFFCWLKVAQP